MERILLRKELPNKIPQNMFDTFTYQVYRKYCKDFSSWLEENYQVRYSDQLDHVDLDTILSNYESYLRKAMNQAITYARMYPLFLIFGYESDHFSKYHIDLHPTVCNLCGGKTILTSNSIIYGKQYGSGKCYYCTKCGAFVGTHVPRPTIALGILSDENMRKMRKKCHHLFDSFWHTSKERNQCYQRLAMALDIDITFCHFGYFDQEQLEKAYQVMLAWKSKKEKMHE